MKFILAAIAFLPLFLATSSYPQTTAFTYQGNLTDGGNPASGNFQMQFKLFDAASGGTQIGSTLGDVAVIVTSGVFRARLDFGSPPLTGANRWLEIAVRRNSGDVYVTLSPREQIASSPYAVRTLSAAVADNLSAACVGCVTNAQINSVAGAKVTGAVATATTATTAATATDATQFGGLPPSRFAQLEANGNLPIGTSSAAPGYKVDINTNGGGVRAFNPAGTLFVAETTGGAGTWARYYMRSSSRSWYMGTTQGPDNFHIVDETVGQTRFSIFPNSSVEILGQLNIRTSPLDPNNLYLSVQREEGGIVIDGESNSLLLRSNLSRLHMLQSGDILAQPFSPNHFFSIFGQARIHFIPLAAATGAVCYNAAADLVTCGASSLKLKTNVMPYRSGLNVLTQLRPISFDWKDGNGHDIGLGAEDVAKIDPSLTFTDKTTDITGVRYERLNILLINAVNEQQQQLQHQARQIEFQQNQISQLKSLVCSQKRRAALCRKR